MLTNEFFLIFFMSLKCKLQQGDNTGQNGIIGQIVSAWRQSFGLKICLEKRGRVVGLTDFVITRNEVAITLVTILS